MQTAKSNFQWAIPGMVLLTLLSCNQTSKVEERNKAMILKTHEELFGKGNLAIADEVFDSEYSFPGFPEKGPALIKSFVTNLKAGFPDLEYKVDQIIADGNMVSWRRTHNGTHKADYMGYKATGKKVTWQDYVVTQFTEDGKVKQEWGASDFDVNIQRASGVEGVYEYFGDEKGLSILRNGRFVFLVGSSTGQLTGRAGTYTIDGDKIIHNFLYSTNPKDVGTSFFWKLKSWSADTVSYQMFNSKGDATGEGKSLRISY